MRTVSGVVAALTYASLLLLLLRSPFSPLFALLCRLLFSVFFFFCLLSLFASPSPVLGAPPPIIGACR
jgi:magnesium-transporting ATPase (P-type)